MGNALSSDGIKSGTKIDRQCIRCQEIFESWSDDTMTIKGPLNPRKICNECHQKEFKNYNPFSKDFEIHKEKRT